MQPNTEVERACEWLTAAFLPSHSVEREAFRDGVQAELLKHYEGHWYPDQAHRGCAFRSLSCCNGKLDPLLARALKTASIAPNHLLQPKDFVLWVNPGEVKVEEGGAKTHIFCAGAKPNPYDKPKVRFTATKLNVRVDEASSNRSSNTATPTGSPKLVAKQQTGLSPSAHNFVPGASWQSSSQSSQSDASDSEGEQDAPKSFRSSPPPRTAFRPQILEAGGAGMGNGLYPPVFHGMPSPYEVFGALPGEPPLGAVNRFVQAH